jgi:hypothetical protein
MNAAKNTAADLSHDARKILRRAVAEPFAMTRNGRELTWGGSMIHSIEILLTDAVKQLDVRRLRITRVDGEAVTVSDLLRLIEDLERVLNVEKAS